MSKNIDVDKLVEALKGSFKPEDKVPQVLMEVGQASKILSTNMYTLKNPIIQLNGRGNIEPEDTDIIEEDEVNLDSVTWEGDYSDEDKVNILSIENEKWDECFKRELLVLLSEYEKFKDGKSDDINVHVMNNTGKISIVPSSYIFKNYGEYSRRIVKLNNKEHDVVVLSPKDYEGKLYSTQYSELEAIKRVSGESVVIMCIGRDLFNFLFTTKKESSFIDELLKRIEIVTD